MPDCAMRWVDGKSIKFFSELKREKNSGKDE